MNRQEWGAALDRMRDELASYCAEQYEDGVSDDGILVWRHVRVGANSRREILLDLIEALDWYDLNWGAYKDETRKLGHKIAFALLEKLRKDLGGKAMSDKQTVDEAAKEHGNKEANPILRSMFPIQSRGRMASLLANAFREGAAFERERTRDITGWVRKYKSECETKAPDALYKKHCCEQMFKALARYEKGEA